MRSLPSATRILATRDRNRSVRVVSDNLRMGILFFVLSITLFGIAEGQQCQCSIRWYTGTSCTQAAMTSNSLADSEGKGLNCVNLPSPVGTVSYQVNDQQCGASTLRLFNVADCTGQAERIVTASDGACMPMSNLAFGVSCNTPAPPAAPAVPAVPVVPPAVPEAPEEYEEEPAPPVRTSVPTGNPSIFIYVSPQGPFPPGWQYSSSTNISINTGGGGSAGGAWSGVKAKKLPSWIAFPIVIGAALCLFCCLFCVCCYLCRRSRRLKKQRMAASYGGGSYMSDGSPSYDLYAVQTAGYTAPVGYMQSGHAMQSMQTIQKPYSPTVAYPNDPHPVPVNKFPNAAGGNHHHSSHHRSHHSHHGQQYGHSNNMHGSNSFNGHQSYPAHNAYSSHTEHVHHTHPAGFLRDDLSDDDKSPHHRV